MTGKKVVVIGAGAAGLAAAVRLRNAGYVVDVFEKNSMAGGKMYQIGGDGFLFDVGPTIVMMPDIFQALFSLCEKDYRDYIPMKRVDPMLTLLFDGESLSFTSDLVELTQLLEHISVQDTAGWLAYLSSIYQRYLLAKEHFIMRSFRGPGDFFNPSSLLHALQLKTFNDAYSSISKFVKDERLRKALAFQTLYIGISPYEGPSLYTIIPMIELLYGVWFIEGGMYAMAKGMQRLFEEQGGHLHFQTAVEQIWIENGKAQGVVIAGKKVAADYVVCAADFPDAVPRLLKPEYRGKYTDAKLAAMTYSCSCFVLYLGLDRKYPVESLHTIRFAENFTKNVDDIFKQMIFPEDPSFYIYVPTLMDSSLAPPGCEAVYVLVPVPHLDDPGLQWQESDKKRYRDLILRLMEQETVFHDIRQHIKWEMCYTPKDFKEQFNACKGATFGLRPTLLQSNYFRPHNKYPYCDNLYFCGSSTHPGAGLPIVLTSAELAVKELMKDDQ